MAISVVFLPPSYRYTLHTPPLHPCNTKHSPPTHKSLLPHHLIPFSSPLLAVRALYHNISSNPLDGLLVLNSARKGGVTGRPMGTSDSGWFKLTATLPDKSQPSKLRVGPELWGWEVPNLLRGDYWIVAAGNDTGATGSKPYTWAIISGGVPQVSSNGLCKTGSVWPLEADIQTNNIGLWFFTRETVASAAKINVMLQKAKDLGLDTSVLAPVTQVGCTYPDTPPPAPAPVPAPTPNANATAAPSPPPAAIVTIRLRRRWF